MKNELIIGTATLSCSVCLIIINSGFIFGPWGFICIY